MLCPYFKNFLEIIKIESFIISYSLFREAGGIKLSKFSLSIVIPAYNEEKRLGKTIERILDYLKKNDFDYELIVVDDGSRDNTVGIARKFGEVKVVKNDKNRGKGYTVKNGIMNSTKEFVLFSDADLSTPIEELNKFLPFVQDYNIIIGSRRMKESNIKVKQPFYRSWAGKIFPIIVNILIAGDIRDTQCGFKLFNTETAKRLFSIQKISGFSFDAEILYLAKKTGYRIKEIPVIWINDTDSKVSIIRDSIRMLKELLKIRINDLKGLYNIGRLG